MNSSTSSYHFLFDYDGVLIHKVDFAGDVARRYNIDESAMRVFFRQHLPVCLRGEADMLQLLSNNLEEIGWERSAQALFDALYLESLRYNQDLLQIIKEELFQKYPCEIATNQDAHRWQMIKGDPIVQELFSEVYCSCQIGVSKPDQIYFEKVYNRLQEQNPTLRKDQVVFMDDLADNVISASKFGLRTHLFESVENFEAFYQTEIQKGGSFFAIHSPPLSLVLMDYAHAQGYSDILSDPGTFHFLTESGPVNLSDAARKIRKNRRSFFAKKSLYLSILNQEGTFMGYIAIHGLEGSPYHVSFGVHPIYRRQGIAHKTLSCILAWKRLYDKPLEMATHLENEASFQLMQKMPLTYLGIQETPLGKRHVFRAKR